MFIRRIVLNNIRSYENKEIVFPEGSTLLSGDIGSGKTSVLLSIEFALFGLQPGHRGSYLLRNGADEGGVIMDFQIADSEISIERNLKRGKTVTQSYCAITINNEKREMSVTELKNKILEILNYPMEFSKKQNILYKFTVYTPQEEMKQIILEDSDTRINTLRHVFGVDKYKKILENISLILSKIREEKRNKEGLISGIEEDKLRLFERENELETKNYNLVSVEKDLFLKREKRKEIQEEIKKISEKIEERNKIRQEIEKTKIMISNKKDFFEDNNRLMEELNSQIIELGRLSFDESEISNLRNRISLIKGEKEKLYQKNLGINSQINSLEFKNEENRKIEQKISNLESCPTCLQDIDSVYRANVLNSLHSAVFENKKKIEVLEEEKNNLLADIRKTDENLFLEEKKLEELNFLKIKLQGLDEKKERLGGLEKNRGFLIKDIALLESHIRTLEGSLGNLSAFDNVYGEKQKNLDEVSKEEKDIEIKIAELKKEIEVYSGNIDELKNKIEKTEEIKKQLEYISELENWLSKEFVMLVTYIEKNVMAKLKAEFSKFFEEWFNMLVSDNFEIRISDDFTPIIGQQDYEIDYPYLSGGERTAVALAYRLALNQVINSLLSRIKTKDLIILDEPTDGFSDTQLDKMRDVLQELNVKQLIIVSHEQKIEGFVENVLKFKKENGTSFIEE